MIKHDLADLFRQNSVHKKFVINYDGGTITNSDMLLEEFSLEESICSEEELRFGSCEASVIRFPISNVFTSLNSKVLDVSVVLNHNDDKPLKIGKYKVASDVPTADRKRKDITAYDALYDVINANVADWYNAILPNADSAVTLKQFRDSFFGYFGIEQVEVSLINDSMIVTKTIQPTELSGSMVANAICELNGCFGHINRDGLMDYVFLKGFTESVYPSDDLYPADDLFPSGANYHKYTKSDYPSGGCDYQDYVVKKITGLEIRQAEDSVGAFVGTRENPYIVSDNFLTYGKSTEEMTTIAQNMFNVINGIEYRPFTLNTFRGNPCVEVGDGIKIYTDNQIIQSYVLNRTLTGIQALSDSFETNGKEYRTAQVNRVQSQITQLKGKTNILERTVEETRSEITKQTAETKEYADEVARDALDSANSATDEKLKSYSTTSEMRSEISQTAEGIILSVDKKVQETKTYADNVANAALKEANQSTDEKLKSYSTTKEMNSAISQSAESITLSVDGKITETKEYADNAATKATSNANSATDEKLKSYSTTTEMQGKIDASAEAITAEVSKTYTTKTATEELSETLSSRITQTSNAIASEVSRATGAENELSSRITQTASSISSKVSKGEVISEINQSAETVKIKASKIALEGTVTANGNVTIGTDGKLTAKNGSFEGTVNASILYAKDKILMTAPSVGIHTPQQAVGYESGTDNKFPVQSTYRLSLDDIVRIGNVLIDGLSKNYYGNVVGKVECTDHTERIPIGSANNGTHDIAYITSKAKNASGSYLITVNGKWETDEFASHNIVSASSDIRLKDNIKPTRVENALDVINKFELYEFDWKESGAHQKIGFIADYLQEVDERLAVGGGYEEDGTPNYKTVDNFYMQGYIVKAIQELSAENRELKSEIDDLKQSVSFLMEKLGGMSNE